MTMKKITAKTYQVTIYIGSARGYDGPRFSDHDLITAIGDFQKQNEQTPLTGAADLVSVTVTPTTYVVRDYVEDGWAIGAIQYPRFPKEEQAILNYMRAMAGYLLSRFDQNRLSLVAPDMTHTIEKEDAESGPSAKK